MEGIRLLKRQLKTNKQTKPKWTTKRFAWLTVENRKLTRRVYRPYFPIFYTPRDYLKPSPSRKHLQWGVCLKFFFRILEQSLHRNQHCQRLKHLLQHDCIFSSQKNSKHYLVHNTYLDHSEFLKRLQGLGVFFLQ